MKKKNILITLFALILLLSVIAVTYAYYIGGVNNDNAQTANLSTGTMSLTFADNDNGFGGAIEFGQTITKKFTIQNTGTLEASASMHWVNLVNSYRKNSLVYTLEYSETLNGTYKKIVGASVPRSAEAKKEMLAAKVTVPAGKTYYYNLNITLVDSETVDQTTDLDATFFTQFSIEKLDKISDSYETLATLGLTYSDDIVTYTYDTAGRSEYQPGVLSTRPVTKTLNEDYYYEYGDSFVFDTFRSVYILQNFKQLKPSEITEDLTGKYTFSCNGVSSKYEEADANEYTSLSKIIRFEDGKITCQSYSPVSSYNGAKMYAIEDDYGMSYYFRGAPENNYVNFAGFYWRIVRINGDGSIRLYYDGTKAYENGTPSNTDRQLDKTTYNNTTGDNAYVGYMYGLAGVTTDANRCLVLENDVVTDKVSTYTSKSVCEANGGVWTTTAYEATHANVKSSNAKTVLDNWYKINIVDKGFSSYVSDEIFCNDRSIASEPGILASNDTALGYGTNMTYYNIHKRLLSPEFTCPQKNDAFTVNDKIHGNGALTYPIGLINADETIAAGTKEINGLSNYMFLNKRLYSYLMTPYYAANQYANVMYMSTSNSALFSIDVNNNNNGAHLVPVINLSKETAKLLIGTGTMTDPYRLS